MVRSHGPAVGSIGITNEANLLSVPFAPDGAYPHALEAMVDGILVAAGTKRSVRSQRGLGFTAAGDAETKTATDVFWRRGGATWRRGFASGLDFAGLTMYPGGFGPDAPSAMSWSAGRRRC